MSYYANPFDLARNAEITFMGKGENVKQSSYWWDLQEVMNEEIEESHYADCRCIVDWQSLTLADVMAYFEGVLRTHEGIAEVAESIERLWLEKGESAGMIIWLDSLLGYIAEAVEKIAGIETRYYGTEREHQEGLYLSIDRYGVISFHCRPEDVYKLARVEWKNSEVLAAAVKLGALSTVHPFKRDMAA